MDSTGAGDNFNAGFLYGHLKGLPIQECLRIACICGAVSTRALGGVQAQISLTSLEDILGHAQEERRSRIYVVAGAERAGGALHPADE